MTLLQRFLIALVAFAAAVCTVLFGHRLDLIYKLDASCFLASKTLALGKSTLIPEASGTHIQAVSTFQPGQPMDFGALNITDDPEEIFSNSPPSATDFAVILASIREAGHTSISINYPLSWDEMDSISQGLLEIELQSFNDSTLSYPFSRASQPSDLPEAVLKSSLPLSNISGNAESLPIVNRIPITPATFGKSTTLIGFSHLESEPSSPESPYLLARWDDHIILSSLLLTLMMEHHITLNDITVKVGSHIALNQDGWRIPIDEFGRFVSFGNTPKLQPLAAEDFVSPSDPNAKLFPSEWSIFIAASGSPAPTQLAHISRAPTPGPAILHHRTGLWPELACLLFFASSFCLPRIMRWILPSLLLIAFWLMPPFFQFWLPASAFLTIVTMFLLFRTILPKPNIAASEPV